LALGAWGAIQSTAAGLSMFFGGALRDVVTGLASSGALGAGMNTPSTGYSVVYHIEILLLFITLVAIGPLVGRNAMNSSVSAKKASPQVSPPQNFGLSELSR
ncbi:MAG: PucC family protein, partial [Pseudorhodobacter sp.]|nr:PucC family protein [Rhizobacter sp.]